MTVRQLVAAAAAVAAAGCGASPPAPPPKTVPVTGKVILPGGQPLTAGRVAFKPKDTAAQEAIGEVAADGTFTLTSYRQDDGATPGQYVATVELQTYRTGSPQRVRADVPAKYLKASTSDLVIDVSADRTDYTLRLNP